MTYPISFPKLRIGAASAALLALCACEKPAVGEGPSAPEPKAAKANMDVSQPITARGTEPFWAVHITDGKRFRMTRPDHDEITAEAPPAAVEPGRAVWVAQTSDGQQMTVTLYRSDCSDGMSDLRYPMAAEVALPHERLSGCAAPTAELPREGG